MSKVSTIQLNSGPNIKVNLYDVKTFIEQIADVGSKMVVLPENFALMPENDADYIKHAEELGDGQIQNYLSDLASSYKIWIVGGTIPIKSKDRDRVMASTITYNEKGEQDEGMITEEGTSSCVIPGAIIFQAYSFSMSC